MGDEVRVLLINAFCGVGSTGRICGQIADEFTAKGHQVKIAYGRSGNVPDAYKKYAVRIGNWWNVRLHALHTRLTDRHGFASVSSTKNFLTYVDEYSPDLIWLHNLHGYYINIALLFNWLKSHPHIEKRWTLHDCWAFTGHCAHFTAVGCHKWQYGCHNCPQKRTYPVSFFKDSSRGNYSDKRELFNGVENLKLITPSKWLADLVKQSYLCDYPVDVCYNEIDKNIFRPTPSSFREKYNLFGKKIILGVADVWSERKGLRDFIELHKRLNESYAVVLVGVSKKQKKMLPKQFVCIEHTDSPFELAKIYTAADVFVNPSREETFGMTTVEAISCGTKAVVYKGSASEEIADQYGGVVVPVGVDNLYGAINGILA